MKSADARALTLDQIDDEVLKLKKEQFNLRFQRATGQLENTSRVRVIRRDIARLKTIGAQKRAGSPAPAPKTEAAAPVEKKAKTTRTRAQAAAKPAAKPVAPAAAKVAVKPAAYVDPYLRLAKGDGKRAMAWVKKSMAGERSPRV